MFNIHISIERWKYNEDYRVYVSTEGRIKDEHKHMIDLKISNAGYLVAPTFLGWKSVHRLVMLTWRPCSGAEDLTVDHLDSNRRNNAVRNLEWVTKEENLRRASIKQFKETPSAEEAKPVAEKTRAQQLAEKEGDVSQFYQITCSGNGERQSFTSIDEAAAWIATYTGNNSGRGNAALEGTFKSKINNAINNHTKYCGMKWEAN